MVHSKTRLARLTDRFGEIRRKKSHPKVAFFAQWPTITWKQQRQEQKQLQQQQQVQLQKQQVPERVRVQQLEPVQVRELQQACHKRSEQQRQR
jgi:hypothetical protein